MFTKQFQVRNRAKKVATMLSDFVFRAYFEDHPDGRIMDFCSRIREIIVKLKSVKLCEDGHLRRFIDMYIRKEIWVHFFK